MQTGGQADCRTDMTKIKVAFRNFTNTSENIRMTVPKGSTGFLFVSFNSILSYAGQHPHKAVLVQTIARKPTLNCLCHSHSDYYTSIYLCNNYEQFSLLPALHYTLNFFR